MLSLCSRARISYRRSTGVAEEKHFDLRHLAVRRQQLELRRGVESADVGHAAGASGVGADDHPVPLRKVVEVEELLGWTGGK